MSEAASIDRGDLMRFAAPVVVLIGTGLLWRSGQSGHWSPMVTEWLNFVGAGGILPFPVAAYFIVDGCLALRRASAAVGWPRTRGKIESSEVRPSGGYGYYVPDVSYSYAVDGTFFTSDAIQSTRIASSSEAEAREIAARYPVGAEVDVRYDSRCPESSVLELGGGAARGRMIIAAIMIAAPIIFATLAAWKNSFY
jgi:hypothetical protein